MCVNCRLWKNLWKTPVNTLINLSESCVNSLINVSESCVNSLINLSESCDLSEHDTTRSQKCQPPHHKNSQTHTQNS